MLSFCPNRSNPPWLISGRAKRFGRYLALIKAATNNLFEHAKHWCTRPNATKNHLCVVRDRGHKMKKDRYRVCAVCGRRHGPTYGFQSMLEGLGIKGTWAAPDCLAKLISFREATR